MAGAIARCLTPTPCTTMLRTPAHFVVASCFHQQVQFCISGGRCPEPGKRQMPKACRIHCLPKSPQELTRWQSCSSPRARCLAAGPMTRSAELDCTSPSILHISGRGLAALGIGEESLQLFERIQPCMDEDVSLWALLGASVRCWADRDPTANGPCAEMLCIYCIMDLLLESSTNAQHQGTNSAIQVLVARVEILPQLCAPEKVSGVNFVTSGESDICELTSAFGTNQKRSHFCSTGKTSKPRAAEACLQGGL